MSIALMTLAWKCPIGPTSKLLLIALCDIANDQGEAFPSVAHLAEKTGLSIRAVQNTISMLEQIGILTREFREGRSTVYVINPRTTCTPAPDAPPHDVHPRDALDAPLHQMHPAPDAPPPPHVVHPTPARGAGGGARGAPITVTYPSSNHHLNHQGNDGYKSPIAPMDSKSKKVSVEKSEPTPVQIACRKTWESYSMAYFDRYGTEPVRNAKVATQVKGLVSRIGQDEAPQVAAWFVGHPDAWYTKCGHAMGVLVKDAEKLRTEWATGKRMTGVQAQQQERTGSMLGHVESILRKRRESAQ